MTDMLEAPPVCNGKSFGNDESFFPFCSRHHGSIGAYIGIEPKVPLNIKAVLAASCTFRTKDLAVGEGVEGVDSIRNAKTIRTPRRVALIMWIQSD